jgi:hypothetical protein
MSSAGIVPANWLLCTGLGFSISVDCAETDTPASNKTHNNVKIETAAPTELLLERIRMKDNIAIGFTFREDKEI